MKIIYDDSIEDLDKKCYIEHDLGGGIKKIEMCPFWDIKLHVNSECPRESRFKRWFPVKIRREHFFKINNENNE